MDVQWWMYVVFLAGVIVALVIDLKVFHSEEHEPSIKESAIWAFIWIFVAILFGIGFLIQEGGQLGSEWFTGWLVEKALSVDNMFVFVVIFSYFRVPFAYQHQVLFWGILGALVFRGVFIALGTALISAFEIVIPIFGVILLWTAYRIGKGGAENVDPAHNPVLKFAQKRLRTTKNFDGQKMFTVENGKRVATPLLVVLLFIETTDIVFAVDSIPAIFGITREPFIVLTSNVFAILGLRALYFLLGGAMNRLHLLHYGLAIILGFIGVKMILEYFHFEINILVSLAVIVLVLTITTILSLKLPPKEEGKTQFSFPAVDEVPQTEEHKKRVEADGRAEPGRPEPEPGPG